MTRVLILSHDVVDTHMAGPGIRYWELARVLAQEFEVTLAVPERTSLTAEDFELFAYPLDRPEVLAAQAEGVDAVLAYGYAVRRWPFLTHMGPPWIADVYIPEPTEALGWHAAGTPTQREEHYAVVRQALGPLARHADFFICASERQRDFWLGMLAAAGRLGPQDFAADPTLRCLVDVVPFGLPSEPPCHRRAVLKGIWPGIEAGDRVVLWGGGLWDWLDPLTLVRAMAQVAAQHPRARLVFPGTRHPNVAGVHDMAMRQWTVNLAEELGLAGRSVFFGDWVDYGDWESCLLEADIGVSLHFDTVETRFAFRTRVLDYIWAGLPMVVSRGDVLSRLAIKHDLGYVVDCQDEAQVASALLALLDDPQARARRQAAFEELRRHYAWKRISEPLSAFCRAPRKATGKVAATGLEAEADQRARALQAEIDRLQGLVTGYEAGRIMRALAAFHRLRRRLAAKLA
jgi:glycosyltransferase involved in cell wall biosynthesis